MSDIDGVMAVDGVLNPTVVAELVRLQGEGALCTVATGRGYYRYLRCIEGKFTPNFPIIVENGGRICTPQGQTLYTHPVSAATCQEVKQFMTPQYVRGMGFIQLDDNLFVNLEYPPKQENPGAFLPKEHVAAEYEYLSEFLNHLHRTRCCVIAFLPSPGMHVPFPSSVNWTRNDHNYMVMEQGISKAFALRQLCELHRIPFDRVLIAGNDYNDIELFSLPAHWRIAVGESCEELQTLATQTVATPNAFGNLLRQLPM